MQLRTSIVVSVLMLSSLSLSPSLSVSLSSEEASSDSPELSCSESLRDEEQGQLKRTKWYVLATGMRTSDITRTWAIGHKT